MRRKQDLKRLALASPSESSCPPPLDTNLLLHPGRPARLGSTPVVILCHHFPLSGDYHQDPHPAVIITAITFR